VGRAICFTIYAYRTLAEMQDGELLLDCRLNRLGVSDVGVCVLTELLDPEKRVRFHAMKNDKPSEPAEVRS